MKFLGIDYGSKRIGIALSDTEGKLAFPKAILANSKHALEKIQKIIKEENAEAIVIGDSLDFHGDPNPIAPQIEKFTSMLTILNIPTYKEKEFLTSVEARRLGSAAEPADANAAALILQRYLDRKNKKV